MEYDLFEWYIRTPFYYSCRKTGPNQFGVNLVTYNKAHLEHFKPLEQILLASDGKTWTSEFKLGREDLTELIDRLKTWERETNGPVRPK